MNAIVTVRELVSTGVYDEEKMQKYFKQQIKEAKKHGAYEEQAVKNANALLNIRISTYIKLF